MLTVSRQSDPKAVAGFVAHGPGAVEQPAAAALSAVISNGYGPLLSGPACRSDGWVLRRTRSRSPRVPR